jgi:hypothetical protein
MSAMIFCYLFSYWLCLGVAVLRNYDFTFVHPDDYLRMVKNFRGSYLLEEEIAWPKYVRHCVGKACLWDLFPEARSYEKVVPEILGSYKG